MNDLVGTKEAAASLGCSPLHIRRLCREGEFPGAKRIGNTWILPRPKPGALTEIKIRRLKAK